VEDREWEVEEWDTLTLLTVSTPRSRLGSEQLFEDFEQLSSTLPPVGTTRPPLYPLARVVPLGFHSVKSSGVSNSKSSNESRPKRMFKRLVNKPIRQLSKELANE
jgi:hypothetical protein